MIAHSVSHDKYFVTYGWSAMSLLTLEMMLNECVEQLIKAEELKSKGSDKEANAIINEWENYSARSLLFATVDSFVKM